MSKCIPTKNWITKSIFKRRFPFTANSGFFGFLESFFPLFCFIFFCVVFLFVFLSFWCAIWGRFGGIFGGKIGSKCDFVIFDFYWFSIGFSTTFAFGRVLCSSYFGSFFASFFCIDFWSLFDAIWESFWEPFGSPSGSFLVSISGVTSHVVSRAA